MPFKIDVSWMLVDVGKNDGAKMVPNSSKIDVGRKKRFFKKASSLQEKAGLGVEESIESKVGQKSLKNQANMGRHLGIDF